MATQVTNGKAFEWAIAQEISNQTKIEIQKDSIFKYATSCFDQLSEKKKNHFKNAAVKAISHVLSKEKFSKNKYLIQLASDSAGQKGDVRDIIISDGKHQIGISCKTNHDDLKHSRLSGQLDFIKKWGLDVNGCSNEYWDKVKPIFSNLKSLKKSSNGKMLFDDIYDKPNTIYWPVLNAFSDELVRVQNSKSITEEVLCENLISYLIGNNDFYKIIATANEVVIQGFNFHNSLAIPKSKYPKQIVGIDKKNGGIYSKNLRFSGGYTINFRIHNASSRVEPSLKFAISAISFPPKEIYTQNIAL